MGGKVEIYLIIAMVGETEVKERPKSNPDYLMQLMNDRKVMSSLPNFSGIFTHLERLLDEGKAGLVQGGTPGGTGLGSGAEQGPGFKGKSRFREALNERKDKRERER